MNDVLNFISLIRETANEEMVRIFTCGGCYRFYLILKKAFPNAMPYMVSGNNGIKHIVTKINNNFYDINGLYENINELKLMNAEQIAIAENFRYPVMQENEIKTRDVLIKRRKILLNIWKALILFLSIMAIGILRHVSFAESINVIASLFCLGIVCRIMINVYFNIDFNFCPSCGRRLK